MTVVVLTGNTSVSKYSTVSTCIMPVVNVSSVCIQDMESRTRNPLVGKAAINQVKTKHFALIPEGHQTEVVSFHRKF